MQYFLYSESHEGPIACYGCVKCIAHDADEHRYIEVGSCVMSLL